MSIIIILVAIIVFLLWRVKPAKGVKSITTSELKTALKDKAFTKTAVCIDVRTPSEFAARNVKPFKNLPLGSDFSTLPKEKEIIVICQSGMRSATACKQLKKLGYTKITNVRGGMSAY